MQQVGVECSFAVDGRVHVRRIEIGGSWQPVEQGRQWQDNAGRHVLILRPGEQVEELLLRAEDQTWWLLPRARWRVV